MFTGIVEELGTLQANSPSGKLTKLSVGADICARGVRIGDSISVNGVCLTVTALDGNAMEFEVMPETLKVTNLGKVRIGEKVNLERALQAGSRVSGHFVSGHVDCVGLIRRKGYSGGNLTFEISFPAAFRRYIFDKGSIAVDGISLTVVKVRSNTFTVYIIPHTLKNTTLDFKGPSSEVNLEFDILAKSAQRKY